MIIAQGVAGGSLISHSLHRETCEDLQAYAFLTQRAFTQRAVGSVWVETNKDDPPDRYLRWENERLGLELTELTLGPVRAAESDARRMRSTLLAAVEQRPEWYAHLVGRHVVMSSSTVGAVRSGDEIGAAVDAVASALREDRGFAGEGLVLTGPESMPEQLPDRGFYGEVGGFLIVVNGIGVADRFSVAVPCQAQLRRSEAVAALQERVTAKDDPRNNVLVVSCGFPNEAGESSSADFAVFQHLAELREQGNLSIDRPAHLGLIVLQYFGRGSLDIFRDDTLRLPWP